MSSRPSVVVVVVVIIMCCCRRLSSAYVNYDYCYSRDELKLCKGSNSNNGLCSNQEFDVVNAAEFQAQALDSLRATNYFNGGQRTGCIDLKTDPPVHTYYCCSMYVDGCADCYANAIQRLKEGCSGRDGGNVLLDKCSLRYERFPFCQ